MLGRRMLEGRRPAVLSLAALVVASAVALVAIAQGARASLSVTVPANGRDGSGSIVTLLVVIRNEGTTALSPVPFVVLGANALPWNATGPPNVDPGSSATHILRSPCAGCGIPPSAEYFVRVFDVASGQYFFSPVERNLP